MANTHTIQHTTHTWLWFRKRRIGIHFRIPVGFIGYSWNESIWESGNLGRFGQRQYRYDFQSCKRPSDNFLIHASILFPYQKHNDNKQKWEAAYRTSLASMRCGVTYRIDTSCVVPNGTLYDYYCDCCWWHSNCSNCKTRPPWIGIPPVVVVVVVLFIHATFVPEGYHHHYYHHHHQHRPPPPPRRQRHRSMMRNTIVGSNNDYYYIHNVKNDVRKWYWIVVNYVSVSLLWSLWYWHCCII